MIHLDTSFIVDLLREAKRHRAGAATQCLISLKHKKLGISVFVACELRAGVQLSVRPVEERSRVDRLISSVGIVYPDERFAETYGEVYAQLRRQGQSIASMDLLIATAALLDEATIVTANRKHFRPIDNLNVISY